VATKAHHKAALLRDLATIIGKDDDLMPSEIEDTSPDGQRWIAGRDELVAEFERRAARAKEG
jgi:hypothetical protein